MSIVTFENSKPATPNISPRMEYVTEYSSRLDNLSNISLNLAGTPWTVDYFHQILAENEDAKHLDTSMSPVNQSYSMIIGMRLFVTSPLEANTDSDSGVSTVSGSANVYGFLKPAIGDLLTAPMLGGGTGLLSVVEVETPSYNKRQHYAITYNLVSILEEDTEKANDLQNKIKLKYVFDETLLDSGNIPIVTLEQGHSRAKLSSIMNIVLKDYVRDFLDIDTKTFLVPTADGVRIYDDYVVEFALNILQAAKVPMALDVMRYTVDDRSVKVTSLWTVLKERGYLSTDVVDYVIGVENRQSYTGNKVGASLRYAPLDYIAKLGTDNKSPSWRHMHEQLGIDTEGHVVVGSDQDADTPQLPTVPVITTPDTPDPTTIPWTNPNPPTTVMIDIYYNGDRVSGPTGDSFKESEVYNYLSRWVRPDGTVTDDIESLNRVGDSIFIFSSDHDYHSGDGIDLTRLGIAHDTTETLPSGDVVKTYLDKDSNLVSTETTHVDGDTTTVTTRDKDGIITGKTVTSTNGNATYIDTYDETNTVTEGVVKVLEADGSLTTTIERLLNGILQSTVSETINSEHVVTARFEASVVNEGDDLKATGVAKHVVTSENGAVTVSDIAADGSSVVRITQANGSYNEVITGADGQVSTESAVVAADGSVLKVISAGAQTVTTEIDPEGVITKTTTVTNDLSSAATVTVVATPSETTTTVTDENGVVSSTEIIAEDGVNSKSTLTDVASGDITITILDPDGALISKTVLKQNGDTILTDANGDLTEIIKDANGEVLTRTVTSVSASGTTTTITYDKDDNIITKSSIGTDALGIKTITLSTNGTTTITTQDPDGVRLTKTILLGVEGDTRTLTKYGATDDDLISVETITTDAEDQTETSVIVTGDTTVTTVTKEGVHFSTSTKTVDPVTGDWTEIVKDSTDAVLVERVGTGGTVKSTYPDKTVTAISYPAGNVRTITKLNSEDYSTEEYVNGSGDLISTTKTVYDTDGNKVSDLTHLKVSEDRTYTEYNPDGTVVKVKTYSQTPTTKTVRKLDPIGNILYTVIAYRESYSAIHIEATDDGGVNLPVTENMLYPYSSLLASEMSRAEEEEIAAHGGSDLVTVVKNPNIDSYTIVGGITNTGSFK